MKSFLFIFFFLISSLSALRAASLTVYLSKCRSECDTESGKLKIYKGRKLIKKSKTLKTEISNIEAGIYYVQYNTIAEKRRFLEVEIREKEDKVITLCFDDFEYDKKVAPSAIDILKDKERIGIYRKYKVKGVKVKDSIFVSKDGENYSLHYHDVDRNLNEVEVEIIREFEYFLLYFSRKGHFKTKDHYTFTDGKTVIKRKDPTGKWDGFHYLLVDLRLKDTDSCE
jgi:hypothetical protein|tara:strand:+ start:2434 stop:3111 length:678 start_codon:yes stop_codon:yes gene_type:complete